MRNQTSFRNDLAGKHDHGSHEVAKGEGKGPAKGQENGKAGLNLSIEVAR